MIMSTITSRRDVGDEEASSGAGLGASRRTWTSGNGGHFFDGLPQHIEILPVKGGEGQFDRGTEAGDTVFQRFAKERDPKAGTYKQARTAHGRRCSRMKCAIEFAALGCRYCIGWLF